MSFILLGILNSQADGGSALYVAVGDSGTLTTSPDGITWTTRTSGFGSGVIQDVTYGDGLYVIVGDLGKLSTSTDGITWTSRTSGFSNNAYGVTYGDGVYVAVAYNGELATSTNATSWTSRTSGFGTTTIRTVMFGDGTFAAGGSSGIITTISTPAINSYLSLEPKSPLISLP